MVFLTNELKVVSKIVIAISVSCFLQPSYAAIIAPGIITPGSYRFTNLLNQEAEDFTVRLLGTPPFIDVEKSTGGELFSEKISPPPDPNKPGVDTIRYEVKPGQNGLRPGGSYLHNFPNWPPETRFRITFSYKGNREEIPKIDMLADQFNISFVNSDETLGETIALETVPESSSIFALITIFSFGIFVLKRVKN